MSVEGGRPDWERLNAYVDGELAPDQRAEIAASASAERETAAMVATLARLKAVTVEAYAAAEPPGMPQPRRHPARTGVPLAVAAALLLTLFASWRFLHPAEDPAGALALALEEHRAWLSSDPAQDAGPDLVRVMRFHPALSAPRLDEAGLAIMRIAAVRLPEGDEALSIGYLGSRGCRVTLWIAPLRGDRTAAPPRVEGVQAAAWSTAGGQYLLLASGMPAERFATIAEAARDATFRGAPAAERLRVAMREQREHSLPCLG